MFNPRQLHTRILGWFPVVIFQGPSLLSATLHSVCSPLASVRDGSLPLQLRLSDSNSVWLTPAVTPHPNVDLIKACCRCQIHPAVSHSSLAVSKAVGQGWSPVPLHEAWREWHPAQDVPSQAKVQAGEVRAAGSIVWYEYRTTEGCYRTNSCQF